MPVEFVVLHLKQSTTDMKTFFSFFFYCRSSLFNLNSVPQDLPAPPGRWRNICRLCRPSCLTPPWSGCPHALFLSLGVYHSTLWGGLGFKETVCFFPILKITLSNVLRSAHVHTRGSRLDVFSLLEERLDFSKFKQSFIVGAEVKDGAMTDLGWHHCRILHHTWSMKTDKSTVKVVFRIY